MPKSKRGKNPLLLGALAGAVLGPMMKNSKMENPSRIPILRSRMERKEKRGVVRKQSRAAMPSASQVNSASASADSRLVAAPVAAGMMMRGPTAQFGSAPPINGVGGIRLKGRQIWGSLAAGTASGLSSILVFLPWSQPISGTSQATITFDPDDTKTMPQPMTNLAAIFARYVLRKCRIVYTPNQATSQANSFAMAVNTDAAVVQSVAGFSFFQVMEQSNAVSGPVWAMLSLDVPCDNVLRYTYQSTSDGLLTPAEERQDHAFGVIFATSGNIAATVTQGYFHLEYEIDFYELQSFGNEVSLRRLEDRAEILRERLTRQALLRAECGKETIPPLVSLVATPDRTLPLLDVVREECKDSPLEASVLRRESTLSRGWTLTRGAAESLDPKRVQVRSVSEKG